MIALIAGTVLAVSALVFVLYPIFFGGPAPPHSRQPNAEGESPADGRRELEFDRATGKLSDSDYAELEARYAKEANVATGRQTSARLGGAESTATIDDEIEAAVLAYREKRAICTRCGPRPEPDAPFCSNCGRYLSDRCAACGTPVVARDARYCLNCGNRFAN
jgi:hypothetical protein